jgi:formamidopyrimidine-DNA glycosylase
MVGSDQFRRSADLPAESHSTESRDPILSAMPELPEVEQIKRTLEPALVGSRVISARLLRRDVFRRADGSTRDRVVGRELLAGATIAHLLRHGKNLAIIADTGRALCVHLGMSGQLLLCPAGRRLAQPDHVHAAWTIENLGRRIHHRGTEDTEKDSSFQHSQTRLTAAYPNSPLSDLRASVVNSPFRGRLIFRDPRRFGGLWAFNSVAELIDARFAPLGPDALSIMGAELRSRLGCSARPIKAALLDQSVIAGVGNIYADEALFLAGVHPALRCNRLDADAAERLARAIVTVLTSAITHGGSTIRTYVDSDGSAGSFSQFHQAYGRAGLPCLSCGRRLAEATIAQRTTVFCRHCQPLGRSRRSARTIAPPTPSYPQSIHISGSVCMRRSGAILSARAAAGSDNTNDD